MYSITSAPPPKFIAELKRQGAGVYISPSSYNLPKEILEKSGWQIYHYLTLTERRPLNEAKLILIGDGAVGKTCIINRLIYENL
jgi:hypothetical protein